MPPGDAAAKARQRARNGNTRSGSSGAAGLITRMLRKSYRDIAGVAVAGPQFAGQVTDVRMLANRDYTVNIQVPAAYAHDLVDLGNDSATMFTFFRSSYVPRKAMLPEEPEDEDTDDE